MSFLENKANVIVSVIWLHLVLWFNYIINGKWIHLTGYINTMHIMTPFDHSISAVRMEENKFHSIQLINLIHSTDSCTLYYTQHDTIWPFDKCLSNGRKWCPFDRFEFKSIRIQIEYDESIWTVRTIRNIAFPLESNRRYWTYMVI